jgi:hypothetical protein
VEESKEEHGGSWVTLYYVRYRLRSGEEVELGKYGSSRAAEPLADAIACLLGVAVTRYHIRVELGKNKRVKL